MDMGSRLSCPYPCPSLGLLEAPGKFWDLTTPRGTVALAKHQFACLCDSASVCKSYTSIWCTCWLVKDPQPPPRVPKHFHHHR